MSNLSNEQINTLLQAIRPSRVGKTPDGFSHVEGYELRAMMIRIFGFGGWSEHALEPAELLYEVETTTRAGKPAYNTAYRASRRLVIGDMNNPICYYDGTAVGESTMPNFKRGDGHDMAIKTAETQAFKRCCANLGDQFGLSLYRQGSTSPLVRKLVHMPDSNSAIEDADLEGYNDESV